MIASRHRLQVGSRTKRLVSGSPDDDDPGLGICFRIFDKAIDRLSRRGVDGIHRFWTIQRDPDDVRFDSLTKNWFAHSESSYCVDRCLSSTAI
jgi:hypothetical protein